MNFEFTLPSDPSKTVRLREATVQDAMDFSSFDPEYEERKTTLFLERMQEKTNFMDPKLWTGEDRRYALFQYLIHTTKMKDIALTYKCPLCNKQHSKGIPFEKILKEATDIKGAPFREFPHEGHNVTVHPLLGVDLEYIEEYRYDLVAREKALSQSRNSLPSEEIKKQEAVIRTRQTQLYMLRLLCCIDMKYLDENGTPQSRRPLVDKAISSMPASAFYNFVERVEDALIDMRHGLLTSYDQGRLYLDIPDVRCDDHPAEEGVTLRYPFRPSAIIPTI